MTHRHTLSRYFLTVSNVGFFGLGVSLTAVLLSPSAGVGGGAGVGGSGMSRNESL